MVAKVSSGKSIRGVLSYNEQKVTAGKAQLILASRFSCELAKLSFYDKLSRFENLNKLHERSKTNAVHISLNFDPSEKISTEKLQRIAAVYMEKIGFGYQPYLVYKHADTGHPHIHIASNTITRHGERIDLHNIGRKQSEQARKEIEIEFNLIKAQEKQPQKAIHPFKLEQVRYGKTETKMAITNIVNQVISGYKFTSLPELNAILRDFNVTADRGHEGSRMFEKKGLVYSLIEAGNKVGVPIKASTIYGKPTLQHLEEKFALNADKRKALKLPLRMLLDKVLAGKGITRQAFIDRLKKEQVTVAFRVNDAGLTYGVTFVDHKNKVVFNGSDLGKAYSAKALTDRLLTNTSTEKPVVLNAPQEKSPPSANSDLLNRQETGLMEALLAKTDSDNSNLMPRKKRKKRKGGFRL